MTLRKRVCAMTFSDCITKSEDLRQNRKKRKIKKKDMLLLCK